MRLADSGFENAVLGKLYRKPVAMPVHKCVQTHASQYQFRMLAQLSQVRIPPAQLLVWNGHLFRGSDFFVAFTLNSFRASREPQW